MSSIPKGLPLDRLLGREIHDSGLPEAEKLIAGRRIAITGAAGSVGAPLAQFITELAPASLVLLDHHEHTLFKLRQEMPARQATSIHCVLADVRDRRKLESVFRVARPEIVFHLAAYKHVPLGEENPDQTVAVNLGGTRALIEVAAEYGAASFVYPSSDKAVKPPSVYGSTKKVAEALTLAADHRFSSIGLSVSRFVNITGTRGSVIETLSGQISAGTPLTLTDPGMTRYWITMGEAIRLLLVTAASPSSGMVYMPDPGPALNLADMARRLHELLARDGSVPRISCIGARPGERMHEILLSDTERAVPTIHPGIVRVESSRPEQATYPDLCRHIDALLELADGGEPDILRRKLLDLAMTLQ